MPMAKDHVDEDVEELKQVQLDKIVCAALRSGCKTSWTRSGKIGTLGAVGPPSRQDGCAA